MCTCTSGHAITLAHVRALRAAAWTAFARQPLVGCALAARRKSMPVRLCCLFLGRPLDGNKCRAKGCRLVAFWRHSARVGSLAHTLSESWGSSLLAALLFECAFASHASLCKSCATRSICWAAAFRQSFVVRWRSWPVAFGSMRREALDREPGSGGWDVMREEVSRQPRYMNICARDMWLLLHGSLMRALHRGQQHVLTRPSIDPRALRNRALPPSSPTTSPYIGTRRRQHGGR